MLRETMQPTVDVPGFSQSQKSGNSTPGAANSFCRVRKCRPALVSFLIGRLLFLEHFLQRRY